MTNCLCESLCQWVLTVALVQLICSTTGLLPSKTVTLKEFCAG